MRTISPRFAAGLYDTPAQGIIAALPQEEEPDNERCNHYRNGHGDEPLG